MIFTTVINHRIYIHFNSWVRDGKINITNGKSFKKMVVVANTDFEVIDIPAQIHSLQITIETEEELITKQLLL